MQIRVLHRWSTSWAALRHHPQTSATWGYLALWAVYLFCYPFAVAGVALDVRASFSMTWAGSFLLAIQGLLAIGWLVMTFGWRRGGALAILVALGGALGETIGVATGWPFGPYRYDTVLLPQIPGGVPLPVVGAWLHVVVAAVAVTRFFLARHPLVVQIAIAALLGVGLDLVLEPVAVHIVGYWHWLVGGPYYQIPLSNFLGWGLLSALFCGIVLGTTRTPPAPSGRERLLALSGAWLYVLTALMFGIVALTHALWLAAGIGLGAVLWVSGGLLASRAGAAYDAEDRDSERDRGIQSAGRRR